MNSSNHYDFNEWTEYYHDTLKNPIREQMEEHLLICDECMDIYLSVVDSDEGLDSINIPSQNFTKDVMDKLPKRKAMLKKDAEKQLKRIMFYYVSAASIAIMLTASGFFSLVNSSIPKISAAVNVKTYSKGLAYSGWSERLTDKTSNIINSLVPNNMNK